MKKNNVETYKEQYYKTKKEIKNIKNGVCVDCGNSKLEPVSVSCAECLKKIINKNKRQNKQNWSTLEDKNKILEDKKRYLDFLKTKIKV